MRLRQTLIWFVAILIFTSNLQSVNAAAPKVGSQCTKLGKTQVSGGKTYTCVKSGKKKVWSKGKEISNSAEKPVAVIDLNKSELITASNNLTDIQICKTKDVNNYGNPSNGFPRPAFAKVGKLSARLLFLPISFPDFPFKDSELTKLKAMTEEVASFYSNVSYGKVSLTFEFADKSKWVLLNRSAESYGLIQNKPQQDNEQVVIDAFAQADPSINFDQYDGVIFESAYFQATGGGHAFPGKQYQTKNGVAKAVAFEFGVEVGKATTLAHELGHSLFGLEDLYVFLNANRPSVPEPNPAGNWDMMSTSARDFLGWNRLLMGWIDDQQVRCIKDQKTTVHYLESINLASTKPKLLLINLQEGVTLAIESRSPSVLSISKGLLVYKIDTRISHGDGPIQAQNLLLLPGMSMSIEGWNIRALNRDDYGVLVQVEKVS